MSRTNRAQARQHRATGDDGHVARHDDADADEMGPRDEVRFGLSRPRRRRPVWLFACLAAVVVVAVAVVVSVTNSKNQSASPTSPTPTVDTGAAPTLVTTTTLTPSGDEFSAAPFPPPAWVTARVLVTRAGHPLLGVSAGWELFGLGPNEVVRIQFALGRITRTDYPGLQSDGPVSFVIGPGQAVIRPWDYVPGFVVPDGHPARRLPVALSRGGPVLPGPDPEHVWVEAGNNSRTAMALVGLDGRATGTSLPIGGQGGDLISSDGQGYLLITSTGGVYDVRPARTHRVTTGTILAVGPTRFLTTECDSSDHCSTVVIDRATGSRHVLPGRVGDANPVTGIISADGSTAAMFRTGIRGRSALSLVDLRSGASHPLAIPMTSGVFDAGRLAWSPDSKWLFVASAHDRLVVVDAKTGQVTNLGVRLPPISELAVRLGSG